MNFYNRYKFHIKKEETAIRQETKNKYVQIYKGKSYTAMKNTGLHMTEPTLEYHHNKKASTKIVVFDLDETLGSFAELESLWSGILQYLNISSNIPGFMQREFNQLFDLYPEFLRYGILNILEFLLNKKDLKYCFKIFIYTNNQCLSAWTYLISKYITFLMKSRVDVFDQIICAFKVNNMTIEPMRTSHEKSHGDFIRCTMMPKNVELCFVDNTFFSKMKHDKVYYIQPISYYHGLTYDEIMRRFIGSTLYRSLFTFIDSTKFTEFIRDWFIRKGSSCFQRIKVENESEIDVFVYQKMMYHIHEFFYMTTKQEKTRKIRSCFGRFTRKASTARV